MKLSFFRETLLKCADLRFWIKNTDVYFDPWFLLICVDCFEPDQMPSVSGRDSFPLGHKADGAALGLSCDVGFELLAGVYASSGAFEINADGMTITVFTLPFQSQGKHASYL